MHKWQKYNSEQVRTQEKNGSRLVLDFAKDYKKLFNQELNCLSCVKSFDNEFNKYIKAMGLDKKQESGYKLKAKYDGISFGFGKRGRVFNKTITKKEAEELLKNHPKGKDLFQEMPKQPKIDLSKMNKDELKEMLIEKDIEFNESAKKEELLDLLK